MRVTQEFIDAHTPMGVRLIEGGATFRVWAPSAEHVYVVLDPLLHYSPKPEHRLNRDPESGHFSGFVPGVVDGTRYRYWVVGRGGAGFKRDPYARELHYLDDLPSDDYEHASGVVRDVDAYRWVAPAFRTPNFDELILYQLHVGVFFARGDDNHDRRNRGAKLLDAIDRIPYLADLGVTALQPLPLADLWLPRRRNYRGTDPFSLEVAYAVGQRELETRYLHRVNALLAARGAGPKTARELSSHVNQLKLFIDLCHLYGIAVIADVVYSHAGAAEDPQSLHYFDLPAERAPADDLYFAPSGASWSGGRVFDFDKPDVRAYFIENARVWLQEYRADGLHYTHAHVIAEHGGARFLRDLTSTVRYLKPEAIQLAEYWADDRAAAVAPTPSGLGCDGARDDRLRDAVRATLQQATQGASAALDLDPLRDALYPRPGFDAQWRHCHCIESHDQLAAGDDLVAEKPRMAALAGAGDARSWYAASRCRVATGLLLTAPGIPQLFMGQEFMEDKPWNERSSAQQLFIYWDGLGGSDRVMTDFHRYTRDLCWLRRQYPALRGDGLNVFHVHNAHRVLAFHRWDARSGQDVVVVASFNEHLFLAASYRLGFPKQGRWEEVFNSDAYEKFPNPAAIGNYGGVDAHGPPLDGLKCSAELTLPANGLLVFAKREG